MKFDDYYEKRKELDKSVTNKEKYWTTLLPGDIAIFMMPMFSKVHNKAGLLFDDAKFAEIAGQAIYMFFVEMPQRQTEEEEKRS